VITEVFPSTFGVLGQGGIEECFEVGGSRGSRGHGVMGETMDVINGKRKAKTMGGYLGLCCNSLAQSRSFCASTGQCSRHDCGKHIIDHRGKMELPRDIPSQALFPPGQRLGSKATICAHILLYIATTLCLVGLEATVGFTRGEESANNAFIEGRKHALLPCVSLLLSTVSDEIMRKK
jgi:hypothetical protein